MCIRPGSRDIRSGTGSILGRIGLALVLGLSSPSMADDLAPGVALAETAHAALAEGPAATRLGNSVASMAYAPDGSTLAVGMRDPNLVLLLDPTTLAVRDRLEGHQGLVGRLAFSPDGKTLASAAHDGTVRAWDIAAKKPRLVIDRLDLRVRGLAISPDGRRIFTGDQGRGTGDVKAWDAQSGELLILLASSRNGYEHLAISPDGLNLATCSRDKTIRLWDLASSTEKARFDDPGAFPSQIAFLPDGKSLVAVFNDHSIRLFDTATLGLKYRVETNAPTFVLPALSPDGSILATADVTTDRLQLRKTADASPLGPVVETGVTLTSLGFSPDGRALAIVGLEGRIKVYRVDRVGK